MTEESTCIPGIDGCKRYDDDTPDVHVWPCHQSKAWIKQKQERLISISRLPLLERVDNYLEGNHRDENKDEQYNMLLDIVIADGLVRELAERLREVEPVAEKASTMAREAVTKNRGTSPNVMIGKGPQR